MSRFPNIKGARNAKSGAAQASAVWVPDELANKGALQSHESRMEQIALASYAEQKKSRELLQRNEYLMELLSERLNHLEWRSFLMFQSKWSNMSLQASFKAWKFDAASVPTRAGEDRRGYAGSPMDAEDEAIADRELPDEAIWKKMETMPSWIYTSEAEKSRKHRAYFKARSARLEATKHEREAIDELPPEQRRALKKEHFWAQQEKEAAAHLSVVLGDAEQAGAADEEGEGAASGAEEGAASAAEEGAAGAAEQDEAAAASGEQPAQQLRWTRIELH
ncbi:MAG: hypothetical protein GY772_31920 [bacterium]|nr:hypothetical protein [bacterium]